MCFAAAFGEPNPRIDLSKEKPMANEMKKAAPFGMKDKVGYMFGDFGNDFT